MDILKKINNVLEASKRKATAQEIAKARIPTVGHMRPKEVGKKDRVKNEKKKDKRQSKKMLKQYY